MVIKELSKEAQLKEKYQNYCTENNIEFNPIAEGSYIRMKGCKA